MVFILSIFHFHGFPISRNYSSLVHDIKIFNDCQKMEKKIKPLKNVKIVKKKTYRRLSEKSMNFSKL